LGGDWNDGMNRVGEAGKGTSVWLGWFLAGTLPAFAAIARERGDATRARKWLAHLENLKAALESAGWDGAHYRRGYFDDGSPLGADGNTECRIDSIAQSWSVLSGEGDKERAQLAMDAVLVKLADEQTGILKLFTPPFEKGVPDPGYIKGYPPGVRENGGQYTHAATWVVMALAAQGRADDAWNCLVMLNPVNHSSSREAADLYRVEPYVVAADVYGEGDLKGRGGWSWYTGSAGWLYRVAVEGILGIRKRAGRLVVTPVLPSDWPGFSAVVRCDGTEHRIRVERTADGKVVTHIDETPVPAEEVEVTA
ncbi:MAG TPA: protein ndvB, partial [Mycoplana sp.]|nr:protein ndvB [Mycoplana sp.]